MVYLQNIFILFDKYSKLYFNKSSVILLLVDQVINTLLTFIMETTPSQRLVKYFKEKNISRNEVQKITKVSKQSISNWWKEKVQIKSRHIESIVQALNDLNPDWVMTGKGQMERHQEDDPEMMIVSEPLNEDETDYGQNRKECIKQLDRAYKLIDNLLRQIDGMKK